jgi:hypothetical protein
MKIQASPNSGVSGAGGGPPLAAERPNLHRPGSAGRRKRAGLCGALTTAFGALVVILLFFLLAGTAHAAVGPSPAWAVKSVALPTNFSESANKGCEEEFATPSCNAYAVTVTNVGTAASVGEITVEDTLPRGVLLEQAASRIALTPGGGSAGTELQCPGAEVKGATTLECTDDEPVPPGGELYMLLEVTTTPQAGATALNSARVEGGGGGTAVTSLPGTVPNPIDGSAPAAFGVQDFSIGTYSPDGVTDDQAGDHPATISTTVDYTTLRNVAQSGGKGSSLEYIPVQDPKTEIVDLPLGFAGDALAGARCAESAMIEVNRHPTQCPLGSIVGQVSLEDGTPDIVPLFDVEPEAGYPAEFGFEFDETIILLRARILPGEHGYFLSVAVPDIQRARPLKVTGVTVSFFGDPTERDGAGNGLALLTNPDQCGAGPLNARVEVDSWVDPGDWQSGETAMFAGLGEGVTGCGNLTFEPSLEVHPEERVVDSPSGYEVTLRVPQAPDIPGDLATPDLKNAQVSLPEGVAIDPSAADGLQACREQGPEGINITHGWTPTGAEPLDPADPEAIEIAADGLPRVAPGHCPEGSQIGEVEVLTPLLASPLQGHVYLAEPRCGGEGQPACTTASATNGELYGLYLEVAGSGVIVKLRGTVAANPSTGQLTASFQENPQFPFSELKLRLNGGERAPLANPQTCGTFTTTSDLTPWSTPQTADATPLSQFAIGGCAGSMPFAPSFGAESLNAEAGGTGSFSLTFSRHDGEQDLLATSVTLPPGLVGLLAEVPLCGEPAAGAGTCPEASKIGTTTVAAGAGPHPYWVGGNVYLTGPYNGAPFGLSVVVPAKAGPFNLGDVTVRAAIDVNPATAAVTVTSGAFPQIIDGTPLRIQTVNVLVNRSGFMLNPTNCDQQSVTAQLAATQGAVASVSSPFAVEGCKSLAFKPVFTASTQGRASKADGASLDVEVTFPLGGGANIRSVKTDLPLQLPSRLTTLQRACPAASFQANPATCPSGSVVGIVRAKTPVLPGTLIGPAYLVSRGGENFPNLVLVLQADGVRVDLTGDTDIKGGITSTTFKTIPDAPVSTFELYLPAGKYSILGANLPASAGYDLCGRKLAMPTAITAQNGAVVKQTTTIAVTGCPKTKKATKEKKKKSKKSARKSAKRGK